MMAQPRFTQLLPNELRQLLVHFTRRGTRFLLGPLPEFKGLIREEDLGEEAILALVKDAGIGGNVNILNWVAEIQKEDADAFQEDGSVCTQAAERGHLRVLKWARERGFPWDAKVLEALSNNGNE